MLMGITSTIPSEVLFASGHVPADLNNRFLVSTSPPPADLVRDAERRGLSQNLCSWVKGLYAYGLRGDVKTIVVATGGDCADMVALSDLWEEAGLEVIHFAYPTHRERDKLESALAGLMDRLGTGWEEAEAVRAGLEPIREDLSRLDSLTWEWGAVSGAENHRWLVSSSDFESDPKEFDRKLGQFLDRVMDKRDMMAMKRDVMENEGEPGEEAFGPSGNAAGAENQPGPSFSLAEFLQNGPRPEEEPTPPPYPADRIRLGIVGVPPIMPDIHDVLSGFGADVVFNESPFQFSMPYPVNDLVEQYWRYTYPYGARVRLGSVVEEIARRSVDGLLLYQEAFCYKSIQNTYIRGHSAVPTLDLEASQPGPCDPRTLVRLEAFVQMLLASKRDGASPRVLDAEIRPPELLYVPAGHAEPEGAGAVDAGPAIPRTGGAGGTGGRSADRSSYDRDRRDDDRDRRDDDRGRRDDDRGRRDDDRGRRDDDRDCGDDDRGRRDGDRGRRDGDPPPGRWKRGGWWS